MDFILWLLLGLIVVLAVLVPRLLTPDVKVDKIEL